MTLRIFDVDHGFAALASCAPGPQVLFDCGHNQLTGFRPSSFLSAAGVRSLDRLVVSHPDNDHLTDLPSLLMSTQVMLLHFNRSLDPDRIAYLKLREGPLTPGISAFIALAREYTLPEASVVGVRTSPSLALSFFCNSYPAFDDTNNLSLVSFLDIGEIHAIIPGDLEALGWKALLRDPVFEYRLSRVNVFVAPHHGRQSGYCREVFDTCHPDVVIVSDRDIHFDTQRVPYADHANGVRWADGTTRYVLTTRNDGHIRIDPRPQGYWITTGSL